MGILTDVFIATPEEVRADPMPLGFPWRFYPTVQSKGPTQVELGSLQQLLAGRDVAASVEDTHTLDGFEDARAGSEDGPWVVALPEELTDGLAAIADDAAARARVAAAWRETEELRGQVDQETAEGLLGELAALARRARDFGRGKRLYVWICL